MVEGALLVAAVLYLPYYVGRVTEYIDELCCVAGLKVHLCHLALYVAQAEGYVVVYSHIGPEGIVLEKEAHLALVWRYVYAEIAVEHHRVAYLYAAAGGSFQAGYHTQCSGLAAAGRAEQRDEGGIVNGKVQVFHCVKAAPSLCNVFQFNFRHCLNLLYLYQGLHRLLCLPAHCR